MIFFAGLGFLVIGLAIPLILKKVPPNRWYGFRTPDTLANEGLWYNANRYMGRDLIVYGVYCIAATLVVGRLNVKPLHGLLLLGGLVWVGIILVAIRGFLYVNRSLKH